MKPHSIYTQSGDPEYAWVSRHTWQSWRERYKKNATRLDALIASIVDQKKPSQGEKGQYGYVRQDEEKPKRVRKKRVKSMEQAIADVDDEYSNVEGLILPTVPMTALRSGLASTEMPGIEFQTIPDVKNGGLIYPSQASTSADHSISRNSPAEEEMDDEGEWTVRIGNANPPVWGKRKASEERELLVGSKRPRPK